MGLSNSGKAIFNISTFHYNIDFSDKMLVFGWGISYNKDASLLL